MLILTDPRFSYAGISDLTGANYHQLHLVRRGVGRMYATDYKAICQHLDYLAFEIDTALANPDNHPLLRRVLCNKMFVLKNLFPVSLPVYGQINNWAKVKRKQWHDLPFSVMEEELRYISHFIRS
jgi:hypothetical protein